MNSLTHQQAQFILQSGKEASAFEREALAGHLSGCAECRGYASLVAELGRALPEIYPASSLSERDIRKKASDRHAKLGLRFMFSKIIPGTRALAWLGASVVLLVALALLLPHLLPQYIGRLPTSTPSPTPTTVAETPSATLPLPTPTTGPVPTITPRPIPTQALNSFGGHLAFIENGLLTLRDLNSGNVAQVEGAYQQIVGWSPGGAYLLAVRRDGASIVIDAAGRIVHELNNLPQPAFWALMKDNTSSEDWLAVPTPDGALGLLSFPSLKAQAIYEPGSLGSNGLALVRWGSNGEALLTPSLAQLQDPQVSFQQGYFAWMLQNGPYFQNLAVGGNGGFGSADFRKKYYLVLDSVPGGSTYELLGFFIENQCSSCLADGLQLVSLDAWSGKAIPLGVALLDTPEAYAWNPSQPGLLALAAGGSRFTLEHKRLALLDVLAGTLQYLAGEDQVVFEPTWSPDGFRLAFTSLPAQDNPSGSGAELEKLLGGRKISVYDLKTGAAQTLTHPGLDEIDGWPRWSSDGKMLLYARKRLADSTTQVRQLDLASGEDRLLVSLTAAPEACHRSGCGWEQMLAYAPSQNISPVKLTAPVMPLTPTPAIQTDTPRQGMTTYHNPAYSFSFQYPASWALSETPNFIHLTGPEGVLVIGFRRATQQAQIQRTGVGAGDLISSGSIQFLGRVLQRDLLVYEKKVKEVLYHSGAEFSAGNLVFTLGLNNNNAGRYEDADIPQNVQAEADAILASFRTDP